MYLPSRLTSCIVRRIGATSPPLEDGQERFADVFVVQKITVHERKLVADELREVGMQGHPPLLRVEKKRA